MSEHLDNIMRGSENTHSIDTDHGQVTLLGTAHVSTASIQEVEETIDKVKPELVCIELDDTRYKSLNEDHSWKSLNIYQVIRQKKAFLLLSNLFLSAYQKRLGMNLNVRPGDEMRAAIHRAEKLKIPTSMIDRDITVTLTRAWRKTGLWGKSKLLATLIGSIFSQEKLDQETIEQLKQRSALDSMMSEMANFLPTVKKVLIDERDEYLAIKTWKALLRLKEKREKDSAPIILAVVGAGHIPGMIRKIQELDSQHIDINYQLKSLSEIPSRGIPSRILPWLLVVLIAGLIISGFITHGWEGGLQRLIRWVLINGSLSALGATVALAHPLTIISSFLAAPITSINPTIGVGFVTGLLEALLRKPRVQDFETLGDDVSSWRGFFRNRVTHILLVFLFSSIGSAIGTFIALPLLFP